MYNDDGYNYDRHGNRRPGIVIRRGNTKSGIKATVALIVLAIISFSMSNPIGMILGALFGVFGCIGIILTAISAIMDRFGR